MYKGLSTIAEQWFISAIILAMLIFLIRKDKDNAFVTLALLIPLTIGLVARDFLWQNPMLWNFAYGMLSIFSLWVMLYVAIKRQVINKRVAMMAFFLFLGVVINYARQIDRMNGTKIISPIYFFWINASNLGVIAWLYMPLAMDLIKLIKRKWNGSFNYSRI